MTPGSPNSEAAIAVAPTRLQQPPKPPAKPAPSPAEVLKSLGVDPAKGLSSTEATCSFVMMNGLLRRTRETLASRKSVPLRWFRASWRIENKLSALATDVNERLTQPQ